MTNFRESSFKKGEPRAKNNQKLLETQIKYNE